MVARGIKLKSRSLALRVSPVRGNVAAGRSVKISDETPDENIDGYLPWLIGRRSALNRIDPTYIHHFHKSS